MATLPLQTNFRKGFSFENYKRNIAFEENGLISPKAIKTGTTIVGIVYKDGVVLGADTRSTEGPVVAEKNCTKIHYLAPNIYCCGAGTAADTEMTTRLVASQLELLRLNTGRESRVVTAKTLLKRYLFRYHGYISAALIAGGVDHTGPHLYSIHPHGSIEALPYLTMGSGSLAAISVLEDAYKPNLEREQAIQLVRAAVRAGIFNDLGSGSNVDLCVITPGKVDYLRNYDIANLKGKRQGDYKYKPGTTATLSTKVQLIEVESTVTPVSKDTPGNMDTT